MIKQAGLYKGKLLLVMLLFAFSMEAYVSLVHYQKLTLEDLVGSAQHIVVVREAQPATSTEVIKIHKDSEKYPPFSLYKHHYVVTDVLYSSKLKSGDKIDVLEAQFDSKLDLHKRYYLEGVSKSPIYSRYECKACTDNDKEYIIFLSEYDGRYSFSATGSVEVLSSKNDIVNALKSKDTP